MNRISKWLAKRSKYTHPELVEIKGEDGKLKSTGGWYFKDERDARKVGSIYTTIMSERWRERKREFLERVEEYDESVDIEILGEPNFTYNVSYNNRKLTEEEPWHCYKLSIGIQIWDAEVSYPNTVLVRLMKSNDEGTVHHLTKMSDFHIMSSIKVDSDPLDIPIDMFIDEINEKIDEVENKNKTELRDGEEAICETL